MEPFYSTIHLYLKMINFRNVEIHILFGHFICMESIVQPAKLVVFFVLKQH